MVAQSEIVPSAPPNIIVVDDDPAVLNSLKFSFEVEGFAVRAYPNGTELLIDAIPVGSGCLVIDYRLPGINGLDLLAELRRRQVTLPAVLITTHPSGWVRARAEMAGVCLIEKPLLDGSLLLTIRAALADGPPPISSG